jgi:hypothetical protein
VALALVIYASSHLAILAVFFPNPRLALPVTLALALGAAWIRPWWLLATATGFVGFASVPGAMKLEPAEAALAAVAREVSDLRGPFLSTSPWFYKQEDGWLVPSIPMREAGGDPRRLSPTGVLAFARRAGFRHVVVDAGRVGATYPGLRSLLRSEPPAGLELVVDRDGWRVYAVGDPQPTDP